MAWGGGLYTVQNKVLPGAYFKFESDPGTHNVFSDRGTVAIAETMDWGKTGINVITREEFLKNSEEIFGYSFADEKMKKWRELFYGAEKIILYRLGTPVQASNKFAKARFAGARGNDISITITGAEAPFKVITKVSGYVVDEQTVTTASELMANKWVTFTNEALKATENEALKSGSNGSELNQGHQEALKAFESYTFDVLACVSTEETIKKLYEAYTKRLIEDVGIYHQLVLYKDEKINDPYVISVHNKVKDEDATEAALVYYVAGIEAACAVNKDLTAHDYVGEYTIDGDLSKDELVKLDQNGQFVFHRVNDTFTVLNDINTWKTYTPERGEDFRYNQAMRVLNQRANDVQKIFTKYYLGKAGIDKNARMLFKNDLVSNMEKGLVRINAVIDYVAEDTLVEPGDQLRSFHVRERIRPNLCVTHLYHDIVVSREGE